MNYREVEVFAPQDLGASGTKIIDVALDDIVSSFLLIWKTTIATASIMLAPLTSCISKIEIIDGSDVLFSLSGAEAQALAYYNTGASPFNNISLTATDETICLIPILFGRFIGDDQLAFKPSNFRNPQLRITWDEDASNTSVVVNELSVRAMVFDQKAVSPVGFLMSKEIKSFVPAANSNEYTDLPTDYPYRLMMLQSNSTTLDPFTPIGSIKLSEEHDKKIPFDMTGMELFQRFVAPFGFFSERVTLDAAVSAKTLYSCASYLQNGSISYDGTAFVTAQSHFAVQTITNQKIALSASVDIKALTMSLLGTTPNSCIGIPFGNLADIGDVYEVGAISSLQLTTKGASAVGSSPTMNICLQQIRK